jgi:diguanylate cyclase (GGDEF)-like protein
VAGLPSVFDQPSKTVHSRVGNRPPIVVTISIGVSEFGRDGDTLDELLSVADQRLYRAKHEGRNRVIAA